MQRRYLDPVSEQAGYFGIVEEGSNTAIVTVRVRVQNRKITEAEWLITRAMAIRDSMGLRPATRSVGRFLRAG